MIIKLHPIKVKNLVTNQKSGQQMSACDAFPLRSRCLLTNKAINNLFSKSLDPVFTIVSTHLSPQYNDDRYRLLRRSRLQDDHDSKGDRDDAHDDNDAYDHDTIYNPFLCCGQPTT